MNEHIFEYRISSNNRPLSNKRPSIETFNFDPSIETFNFGTDFQKWIRVIYSNISSCTINNGYVSPFFLLHRGVRQGCPISGMLFVLAVELLSCAIRSDNQIEGIKVNGEEIKLSQYADELLELLDQFKECSGLKMNKSKSEAMSG